MPKAWASDDHQHELLPEELLPLVLIGVGADQVDHGAVRELGGQLDHVIVLNEKHLRRRLRSYLRYYHGSRTHLALEKDAPEPRAVEPPEHGPVVALPHVGGLHHRYVRHAA